MPGFRNALASRIAVETPAQRAQRVLAEAKAALESSRNRSAPSTAEKIPSNYHGGVAGKIWFLPFWDSTTHDSPEIRSAMRLMRRDGYVKAAWEPQILTVASEDWQIQASESTNRESQEQADFVKFVIEDYFAGGMPQLVRAICAALGSDGHTLSEKVWEYAEKGRLQGKIICRAAKTKDTSETGFGVVRLEGDRYGNVQTVQSRRTSERFPIEDFLYARYMPVFDEPLGEAVFRPAYGPYWMRDTVRKLRIIHHEKKMAGMLLGEYESEDDKGPLETSLAKAKTATWMSIPANTRVQAIALSTATEPDYKSFDESLRDEIVMAIAFAILQQLVGGNPGEARGSAEIQKKISDLGPWLLMAIVMDVVNTQLIPDLVDFNFPYVAGGSYPKLTFGAVSNPELLELIQVVQGAQAIGLKPSRKHYAQALSIKEADPNDPTDQMTPEPGADKAPPPAASPLMFAEDDRGHDHGNDGRFVTKGDGGGASGPKPKESSTATSLPNSHPDAAKSHAQDQIEALAAHSDKIPAADPAAVHDAWHAAATDVPAPVASEIGGHLAALAGERDPAKVKSIVGQIAGAIGKMTLGAAKAVFHAISQFAAASHKLGPYGWWAASILAGAAIAAAPVAALGAGLITPAAAFTLAPAAALGGTIGARTLGAHLANASAAKNWGYSERVTAAEIRGALQRFAEELVVA